MRCQIFILATLKILKYSFSILKRSALNKCKFKLFPFKPFTYMELIFIAILIVSIYIYIRRIWYYLIVVTWNYFYFMLKSESIIFCIQSIKVIIIIRWILSWFHIPSMYFTILLYCLSFQAEFVILQNVMKVHQCAKVHINILALV